MNSFEQKVDKLPDFLKTGHTKRETKIHIDSVDLTIWSPAKNFNYIIDLMFQD